jgi:hypothetical protein
METVVVNIRRSTTEHGEVIITQALKTGKVQVCLGLISVLAESNHHQTMLHMSSKVMTYLTVLHEPLSTWMMCQSSFQDSQVTNPIFKKLRHRVCKRGN